MKQDTYEACKRFVRDKCPDAKCVECAKDGNVGYVILARPSAGRTVTPVLNNKRSAWIRAAQLLGWKSSMMVRAGVRLGH